MLEELDEIIGDSLRSGIRWSIRRGLVRVIRLDDPDHFFGVDGHRGQAYPIFGGHDQVWFSAR